MLTYADVCSYCCFIGEFPADLHPDVRKLVVWEEAVGEGSVVKLAVKLLAQQ